VDVCIDRVVTRSLRTHSPSHNAASAGLCTAVGVYPSARRSSGPFVIKSLHVASGTPRVFAHVDACSHDVRGTVLSPPAGHPSHEAEQAPRYALYRPPRGA